MTIPHCCVTTHIYIYIILIITVTIVAVLCDVRAEAEDIVDHPVRLPWLQRETYKGLSTSLGYARQAMYV